MVLLNKHRHRVRLWMFAPVVTLLCVSCGWIEQPNMPMPLAKSATLDVHFVSLANVPNSRMDADPATGEAIYLVLPPIVSNADVAAVERGEEADGMPPSLIVYLTPAGATKLAAATTPATGRQVAVVIDGKVVSVPHVNSPLSATFSVTGGPFERDFDGLFDSLIEP